MIMKKQSIFLTLMLLAVTMLAGCNDTGVIDEPVENTKKSMVGVWQLLNYNGGFTGQSVDIEPGDVTITFAEDGEMKVDKQTELQVPFPSGTTTYSFVEIERSIFTGKPRRVLAIGTPSPWRMYYSYTFQEGMLVLSEEAYDGYSYVLRKVN